MKCFICGDDLDGQPVVVVDQQIMHRFMTKCRRVNHMLREELERLKADNGAVTLPYEPNP